MLDLPKLHPIRPSSTIGLAIGALPHSSFWEPSFPELTPAKPRAFLLWTHQGKLWRDRITITNLLFELRKVEHRAETLRANSDGTPLFPNFLQNFDRAIELGTELEILSQWQRILPVWLKFDWDLSASGIYISFPSIVEALWLTRRNYMTKKECTIDREPFDIIISVFGGGLRPLYIYLSVAK